MESKYIRKTSIIEIKNLKFGHDYPKRTASSVIVIEGAGTANQRAIEAEFVGGDKGCRE